MNKPKTGITTFVVAVAVVLACATGASAMTVTSTGDSGACTLRAAINAAAANDSGTPCGAVVSGGTTPINLPANTYTPFDGQLVVPAGANIAINGDNVNNPLTTVIDATNASPRRVFEIKSGASVTMSGLTITGGRTSAGAAAANPFQAFSGENGGGILNQGGLTLDHVVVTGNQAGDGGAGANGPLEGSGGGAGAGGSGGGIYNADSASLTVSNSVISDNVAGDGGNGGDGGMGVNASGHFPNGSAGGNGGPGGSGGGIYNSNFGSVTITNSTVSGNFSGRGGNGGAGGQGAGGNATFTSAGTGGDGGDGGNNGKQYRKDQGTFWDDTRGGGGIYNLGTLNMSGSTVKGNGTGAGGLGGPSGPGGQNNFGSNDFRTSGRAGSGGGGGRGAGLLNGSWHQGTMSLTNVTITGNQTGDGGTGGGGAGGAANTLGGGRGGYGGDGGGIWAQGAHDHETLLTHVTIAKNFLGGAGAGGGSANNSTLGPGTRGAGAGVAVGGRFNPGGSGVYLKKTLISSNGFSGNPTFDKNCAQAQPVTSYAEFADLGNNLSYPDDGSPCPGLTNVDPDLGPVGNNGGPTETMVPQPGSAAIGGVPLGSCDITIDQRGFPRPGADGVSCDIGAVETGTAPSTTPTTTGLVSSANPSAPGQQVTYTATVSPPPSSGTVEFKDGGTTIPGCATTPLTPGGQFTCSVTYPAAGSHSIVAAYSGNSLFVASSSSALNQTVQGTTPPPDTTAPDTMIDSGPTGRISQTEATFAFHGTPGDTAKLQCGLDSGAFADCTSPKTFTGLSAGAHNVRFRAVDASGNADASPATGSFTVDTGSLPPPRKASIGKLEVSGPRRVDRGDKATFSVAITNTGNAAASGVKLKVTGGGVNVGDSVGQVGADRTKTVKVKAKLNQAGRKRLTFKVTSANAGARAVSKTVTVRN